MESNSVNGGIQDENDVVLQDENCVSLQDENYHEPRTVKSLSHAISLAEELTNGSAILIPPRWTCPPSLEGHSCVYVLKLPNNRFYVGETDSFRQRLYQHRKKYKTCTAAAISISGGKSQARLVESLLIRKLAKAGFLLESTFDGRVVRSTTHSINGLRDMSNDVQ
jgi:hypothetical protein